MRASHTITLRLRMPPDAGEEGALTIHIGASLPAHIAYGGFSYAALVIVSGAATSHFEARRRGAIGRRHHR